jgi:crossover junction endodeoxyribonuclease RusA
MRFAITYEGKPLTTNAERRGNRWGRADHVKEWRQAFAWLAKAHRIPPMQWVDVTAQPHQARGRLQDTAACNPSVKAAIDGLVDAGIVPDDTGVYVRKITFLPCARGKDSLTLILEGERNA